MQLTAFYDKNLLSHGPYHEMKVALPHAPDLAISVRKNLSGDGEYKWALDVESTDSVLHYADISRKQNLLESIYYLAL